jgi:hypothetical protein
MGPHDELIDQARAATGLDDFGGDSFREGLEILVRALRTEARLTPRGDAALHAMIVGKLSQRLQVEDWYTRHPEIGAEVITRPLFGIGLPRTGSTALSLLLALDPGVRYLASWQADRPCPPPSTVAGHDPRLGLAEAEQAERLAHSPRHAKLVPGSPAGPMECLPLLAMDFKSALFNGLARVPSYTRWLLHEADHRPAFEYEKRVLKLLQWGCPALPWRLKSPSHVLHADIISAVFPDARFVMTHRDPADVIVSVCDLFADVYSRFSDDIDRRWIGEANVAEWTAGMLRVLEFRDAGNDGWVFDIDFRAMHADPIGEVRRLYAWLGEPVSESFDASMRAWWADSGEKEPNTHPDPATFGLKIDDIRPLFADYSARAAGWTSPGKAHQQGRVL